jgi:endoglucanase
MLTTSPETLFLAPLSTRGRYIYDAKGTRIKLCSVNWYGGSDELFVPSGLDIRHRSLIAQRIRSMGFNSVRLPYSDEMVLSNPLIPASLLSANADLFGLRALDVFEAVVVALTDAGLGVVINNHITQAGWCDGKNLCDASWSNSHLGPFCRVRQTEEQWMSHWAVLMSRPGILHNPRVIGCDLRNEPRGIWGTTSWSRWSRAASRCGDRLHELNPDWLIIVEGLGSANDCSGARREPVILSVPQKLVYSVHVFSWSGWGDMDPYSKRAYPGFVLSMQKNWAYLLEEDIAPVWVGEMGAPDTPTPGDTHYWDNLMRYLEFVDADWGYWALNPRKPHLNELETWSLVRDDWETIVDDYRMQSLRKLMVNRSGEKEERSVEAENSG